MHRTMSGQDHSIDTGTVAPTIVSAVPSQANPARIVVNGTAEPGATVNLYDNGVLVGTAAACAELVQRVGGELCGFAFIVELADLAGQAKLPSGVPVDSLLVY